MKGVIKFNRSGTYFLLFVLSVGIHKSAFLIYKLTGINIATILPFTLLVFPILFLYLLFVESRKRKRNSYYSIYLRDKNTVTFILVYTIFLLLYGLIRGNLVSSIFEEFYTGLVIFFAYSTFDLKAIAFEARKKLLAVFILFFLLVLLATSYTREHLELLGYSAVELGTTTASLAYELAPILDFWPLLFGLIFFTKGIKAVPKWWAYSIPAAYIGIQIYFLKRAPTVRGISMVLVAIALLSYRRYSFSSLIPVTVASILILALFYFALPDALLERFQTQDTARQDESINMISQLNIGEWVFGRGLGGEFVVAEGGIAQYINEEGVEMSTSLHIGAVYPILKGGLVFWVIIVSHLVNSVKRGFKKIKYMTAIELTGLMYIIVYSVFRWIEGPMTPGSIFDALLFGLSLKLLNGVVKEEKAYN